MSSLRNLLVIIFNFIFCRLSAPKNILSNYISNDCPEYSGDSSPKQLKY